MSKIAEVVFGIFDWSQANPLECLALGLIMIIIPVVVKVAVEIKYS